MREHLAGCALCHREEAAVRAMFGATDSLQRSPLSVDFNARLLDRIARERFTETRTKAYLPRRAPLFSWPRLIPVVGVVAVAVLAFVGSEYLQRDLVAPTGGQQASLDDSYLTIQPQADRAMATNVNADWSFRSQIAQSERVNRVSGMLTNAAGFADPEPRVVIHFIVPYSDGRIDLSGLRIRPVLRTYEPASATQAKETQSVY
jgi:anti-sigma factor RsiW